MDINATLFVQVIVFLTLVWGTMRFIWPTLTKIMDDRRNKIADGLAAAEQGKKELELAKHKVKESITEAKAQAAVILEQANQRANSIVEEAKHKARTEGERLLQVANAQIEQEYNQARETLVREISVIALIGAEKILNHEVGLRHDDGSINELVREI